jgi:hypothetical protein
VNLDLQNVIFCAFVISPTFHSFISNGGVVRVNFGPTYWACVIAQLHPRLDAFPMENVLPRNFIAIKLR